MNEKKAPKRKYPSTGGSYTRKPDGALHQVEESTKPNPGKTALRRETEAKVSPITKRTPAPDAAKTEKAHD